MTTSTATLAGFQVGAVAGDPSALVNGNVWYDSTAGKFRARQAGVSVDMIGGVTFPILADDGTEAAPRFHLDVISLEVHELNLSVVG